MILIIDGDYQENKCHMAGILIEKFEDSELRGFITSDVEINEKYESGNFYKREMKGIIELLKNLNITESTFSNLDCIVIDGYANFKNSEYKSLGERLYEKYKIPVIGIAKKQNILCTLTNTEIYRGESKNPLYITAIGCGQETAKNCVKKMYGKNRLPYMVKLTDSLARKNQIVLY